KHVSGAVVRRGGESEIEMRRHAQHKISFVFFQGLAEKPAALRVPDPVDFGAKLARDHFSDFVFKSFPAVIGERQIVGISGDAQGSLLIAFDHCEYTQKEYRHHASGKHADTLER